MPQLCLLIVSKVHVVVIVAAVIRKLQIMRFIKQIHSYYSLGVWLGKG